MTATLQTWQLADLRRAIGYTVLAQFVLLMFTAMLLDGGYCSGICMAAIVGHWLMVGWIALRRRDALTKTDTIIIRSGFLLWLAIVISLQVGLGYLT